MQRSSTGLGPVLRKVRLARGVSLDEASRDTRIRAEFLDALEEEEYERLLGDVHVRGCLRSYATYLGIPSDRVLEVYGRGAVEAPPEAPRPRPAADPDLEGPRRRDNARLVVMGAAAILVLAGAFGVLSARDPAPTPAELPSEAPIEAGAAPPGIDVTVLARESVQVTVRIDGGPPQSFALEPGEGRAFEADLSLQLRLSSGSSAQVTVNGKDLGFPGKEGKPWRSDWRYGDPTSTEPG